MQGLTLEHTRHTCTSGPWHVPLPPPGILSLGCPRGSINQALLLGLNPHACWPVRPPQPLSPTDPPTCALLPYMFVPGALNPISDSTHYLSVLHLPPPLERQLHAGRDF